MGNEVTTARGGAVAAASALRKNLATVQAKLPTAGMKPFLRFLQDGNWVFGQENTELPKDVEVAVNPLSVKTGWSCWTDYDKKEKKKNELVDEKLYPLGANVPAKHELEDHGWEWRELVVVEMKVLEGKHKGKELTFNTTSKGGVAMLNALIEQIIAQLDTGAEEEIVPVITLGSNSYIHKQWGKTYVPEFELVDFISMDGPAMAGAGEEEPEPEPEPEPEKPKRSRSRKKEPEPEPEDEEDDEDEIVEAEPVEEDEAPVRRRRRRS